MKALAGEWFSLKWDITDFYNPESFKKWEERPHFLYAEEDTPCVESPYIDMMYPLRLISICKTSVFVSQGDLNIKVPTHYKVGEFMPGDSPKYDKWLAEYHNINYSVTEQIRNKEALQQKDVYLEHAAKIIRHDMHSGINTYLPRAVRGLERRLTKETIEELRLGPTLRLLKEGLAHAQRVYSGVYSFTNLVKKDAQLDKEEFCIRSALEEYLSGTAYIDQVVIRNCPTIVANKSLMCTAIDNLIRNGLKYNDSPTKVVEVYEEANNVLCIKDNGRGLSVQDFVLYCKPYSRDENQAESGSGLGLNIATAILYEHGYQLIPEKTDAGTIMRINLDETAARQYFIS